MSQNPGEHITIRYSEALQLMCPLANSLNGGK